MRLLLTCLLASQVVVLAGVRPVGAAEFFAAPDGEPGGDGSERRPWDLGTALSRSDAIGPGDTLWLRGGTYRGEFTCRLRGDEGRPVTVRQYPGERATIDLVAEGRTALFVVEGDWARFWGFEVTCSDPTRVTRERGSSPEDIRRGSIHCRASHAEFINLVVHDLGNGFGFWSEGEGGAISGCLVYNNGWDAPDRGHGHGIYTQNARGVKRLVDNVLFNQFSHGIHAYGSSRAHLVGYHIEGNAAFGNGSLAGPGELAPNILVGGGSPSRGITLRRNFTYHPASASGVRLGYGAVNEDLTLVDNVCVGSVDVRLWREVTASGNTIVGPGTLVRLELPPGVGPSGYDWDGNTYRSSGQRSAPLVAVRDGETLAAGWREWTGKAGLDAHGRFEQGEPTGVQVFVRPNRHEPGRAHVIVYDWDRAGEVDVDLDGVLEAGQSYRVVSVQDYFGRPVLSGTYRGEPLRLPMRPIAPARPVGMAESPARPTGPEFDVFVVIPGEG